jgi:hypothetical protein
MRRAAAGTGRRAGVAPPTGHRPCTICGHPNRAAIEAAVTSGTSLRAIARANGISARSLVRHRDNHRQQPPPAVSAESRWAAKSSIPLRDKSGNLVVGARGQIIHAAGTVTSPPGPAPGGQVTLGKSSSGGWGGGESRDAHSASHSGASCCSIYCLITDSGASPHEITQ